MLTLDPLPGLTVDDIQAIVGKECTMEDAVIHFNLKKFMDRAIMEVNGFIDLDKEKQYEKLIEYAEEVVEVNKPTLNPDLETEDEFTEPGRTN